ncbi:MAG: hypothetical protein GX348_02660 [Veillonellaceae bacterium]|jgi:hypothetical protein|nr:hypothetical protein [Veillonellaceae bacterium]
MSKQWKHFMIGALTMLILLVSGFLLFSETGKISTRSPSNSLNPTIPSDTVIIKPLPPLLILRGTDVAFEGKAEFKQAIAGRFAQNIVITNFQATGNNAEKSMIKIVWENGQIEKIYPGTTDKRILSNQRAVDISILGYSMHERRIFKDSSRKGTLTWEIRYEPVEL